MGVTYTGRTREGPAKVRRRRLQEEPAVTWRLGNRTHFAGQKPHQGTFLAEGRGFARVEKQEKSWCVQELASPSARVASGSGSPTGKAVKRAGTGRCGGSNRRQHKGLCWLCLLLRLG